MSYYSKHYQAFNFNLVTLLLLLHIIQQEMTPDVTIAYFIIPTVCLYIGATRSLRSYSISEEPKQ